MNEKLTSREKAVQKLRVLRQYLRKCGTKGKTEFIVFTGTVHTWKVNQMPIYWGKNTPTPREGGWKYWSMRFWGENNMKRQV